MVLIIVIVLLVVLLIGGGVAAFLMLSGGHEEEATATAPQTPSSTAEKKKTPKRSTDHLVVGPMYPMAQFVVNLLSESGNRFLKVAIDLEIDFQLVAQYEKIVQLYINYLPEINKIIIFPYLS